MIFPRVEKAEDEQLYAFKARHHSCTQTWTNHLREILLRLWNLLRKVESLNFIDLPSHKCNVGTMLH